ncbi:MULTISPECIES: ParA family protein [Silvimonas]|uniref:ParA family protein n=1 Tax=Silvimonas TaxID=300264 RepID=UPI0024B334B3|nr:MULTISPECIES: ParA family protein [Silvimonas]MDR3427654.1 ParA family protein [Silvimonas sp.]
MTCLSILIANPKGGSGKSTLSTNLAGYFAWQSERVVLGDLDRQHTARYWLGQRPPQYPLIGDWDVEADELLRPSKGVTVAILDSPAGLHGKKLESALKLVDRVLVPVVPSAFDMWALEGFFAQLAEEKAVRKKQVEIGIVGMRVDPRTHAARQLETFLAGYGFPVLTYLRNTQLYVQLQPKGLTLFDLPAKRFERDLEQWQAIPKWLRNPASPSI